MRFFRTSTVLWGVYAAVAVLTAWQRLFFGFDEKGYSRYENYRIFRYSWHYLVSGGNPYTGHPETWDLYKYSPAFSVAMAPFYALPDLIGLPIWNLLNAIPLLAVLLALPGITTQSRIFIAWIVLPELTISLQNTQSNGLMAALLMAAYIALSRTRPAKAAGWIIASSFIKIFGIFATLLILFYPKQWRSFALGIIGWTLFLGFIPIVFTGWEHLKQVYEWWGWLLKEDHATSTGLSVAGWLQTWFGAQPDKTIILVVGVFFQCLATFLSVKRQEPPLMVFASLLIWVVIFNHKAESPTFIIAMCGAAIWYVLTPFHWSRAVVFWSAFVLASIAPTDLFPRALYNEWVQPYTLKAVPFILIWVWQIFDLITRHEQRTDLEIS